MLEDGSNPEAPARTPSPFSAEGMPNGVPANWKPTLAEPLPVIRCTVIKADGNRCKRFAIRGGRACVKHGGQLPTVKEHAAAVLEAARMRLLDDADLAVDVLEQLMQPGTAEGIRLKAAESVLDRAGIRGGFEVDVEVEHKQDPAELIATRLEKLRKAGQAALEARAAGGDPDEDVLDAEIVTDDLPPEQETLF